MVFIPDLLAVAWATHYASFRELFLSASPKFLDEVDERFPLGPRQAGGHPLHRLLVDSKDFPDPRRAFRCQRDEPGAPILGVGGSNDEP